MFTSLDHPAIACFDVEKQAEWYCRNFGMNVIASNGEKPPAMVIGYGNSLRGGAMIELMPVKNPGADPASIARFAPGIRHVALRVSNFESAYAKLKEMNDDRSSGQAVGGGKTILFRDPKGNRIADCGEISC